MMKRIQWVDIVKGIAILSMIMGHSLTGAPGETLLSLLIYSFHMPIFFIMSGFTTKILDSKKEILEKVIRLSKKILIPTIIIVVVCTVERIAFNIYDKDVFFKAIGSALFYAQPTPLRGHYTVDAMWFLIVFFWSKGFFYAVTYLMGLDYAGVVFGVLAYICNSFSNTIWLIQSWDLVPLGCLFMWIGGEFKKNYPVIKEKQVSIFLIAFVIWMYGFQNQVRVDMATRLFPNFVFCLIFIVSASFCIIYFSEGISGTKLGDCLAFFGRETLPLLYINAIDFFWIWGTKIDGYAYTLTRVALDIMMLFVWILITKLFTKLTFRSKVLAPKS
ncbi:acyltransferase family protein [Limosilactobacillus reuteri]|uniref:acyltransferase family protein n=1 Tax=Limosilactobacillus reuteri TaxID=1598 RepID=UPI0025520A4F|nr:acyltransferase family protein [Limosilactobacillus reuteri]MDL2058273.1 acyltransferase family protein [Limosilactobacillus reuteri]